MYKSIFFFKILNMFKIFKHKYQTDTIDYLKTIYFRQIESKLFFLKFFNVRFL